MVLLLEASQAMNISHTREVSSTLPKKRRLSCPGASGNTGGGRDRDNTERQNRAGRPWPMENGDDVEAAAWLTLDSTLFKREESGVSDRHGALDPSSHVLLSILFVPAFATSTLIPLCRRNLLFWICPGGGPIWWWLHKHFSSWGSGKGHSKLLRKSLVLTLAVEGPVCNPTLTVMSISSSIVQWRVLHFSGLFAFLFITFINTSLSFPLRNISTCWKQMMVALQFETYLTAKSKVKWNLATAFTWVGWPCSDGIKQISPVAQNRIFEVSVSFFWLAL